jgi:membrane protease YdiL (CAAX protease family)
VSISFALQLLLVAFLVVVFPIWDRRETLRLKTSSDPLVRVRSYQKTIGWQLIATALLFAAVPYRRLFTAPVTPRDLGIDLGAEHVIPIVIGLLIGFALPVLLARFSRRGDEPVQPPQLTSISFFLPRGSRERAWFAAMCVVVGVCEEIVFRGFLIRFFAEPPVGVGLAAGVAVAAVIFGIDHGYQGVKGIVTTGVLALVFTAFFFGAGSLWLPIVVHTLLDLRVLAMVPNEGIPWPAEASPEVRT